MGQVTHFFVVMGIDLVQKLRELVVSILAEPQYDLVDLQIKGQGSTQVVRVFVDKRGGITLDECEAISRQLSDAIDSEDTIPGSYRLEVSSPGLDRPLRTAADFRRNIDRDVEITYSDADEEQTVTGKIVQVSDDRVEVQGRTRNREILISTITRAKIHLPW